MSNLLSPIEAAALLKRFREIERWIEQRDETRPESFFSTADPSLEDDMTRMAYVRRSKEPRMYDTDDGWISKCEGIIRSLPVVQPLSPKQMQRRA